MKNYTELRPILLGTGVPEIKAAIDAHDRAVVAVNEAGPRPGGRDQAEKELAAEVRQAALEGRPSRLDRRHVATAVRVGRDDQQRREALNGAVATRMRELDAAVWSANIPMYHALCRAWSEWVQSGAAAMPQWLQTLWTCFGWPPLAEGPGRKVGDMTGTATDGIGRRYRGQLWWPVPVGGRADYAEHSYERNSWNQHVLSHGAIGEKRKGFTVVDGAVRFPEWKSPGSRPLRRGDRPASMIPAGSLIWIGGSDGFNEDEIAVGRLHPVTFG